jgi:Fur family peroxide stress response transcriptional regulator
MAVAKHVLHSGDHPSADQVWTAVKRDFPTLSRATTYNTLNLFVKKGLLRQLDFAADSVVFDPNTSPHHHLIDRETKRIYDIPWDSLEVRNVEALGGFDIDEYQVVLRGKVRPGTTVAAPGTEE